MWKNIIMLCGFLLLVGGMYQAYFLLKNATPQQMTVAEFLGSHDDYHRHLGTVLLTDARLNLLKAIVITGGKENRIKKLYLPIESIEFLQGDKVSLLLDTSDVKLLNIASKIYRMSKKEQRQYVVHHRQELLQERELGGIMLDRHSMRASRLQEIRTVVPGLADDFFVLRHQAKVSLVRSLIISILGLFILTFGLFREEKAEPVPPTDSTPA
ncbi:MAG: hypothetical protein D3913_03280 [Candidatus Electrothrix sp. LOE1_4_5]|nr:hypothetical protein [Candidatus Electrothrix gigas]MCI5128329.1 hypothetical protein [Candidatus Electrothrix gigas]MCI5179880.1 hypothetical protein [Candidatus Electrothrix gigas]